MWFSGNNCGGTRIINQGSSYEKKFQNLKEYVLVVS